jgi:hypothetical protein
MNATALRETPSLCAMTLNGRTNTTNIPDFAVASHYSPGDI